MSDFNTAVFNFTATKGKYVKGGIRVHTGKNDDIPVSILELELLNKPFSTSVIYFDFRFLTLFLLMNSNGIS